MKWLLNFVPYNAIIEFLCGLIKEKWTSKTETTIDDKAVDEVLEPALKLWMECAVDPNVTFQQTAYKNGLLIINFLDDKGLVELEKYLIKRREKLNEPNK